ncbi:stress response protein nst1-like [Belonocnema kinseyi]|uniref:stress response protein nst1-like n=1 Tax=Belonocnema kinseyi TaxID=2817044 RepID=UPI00143D2C12|nr:stress response protein nst1-like [Belonocnema kinseyi]
MTGANKLSRPNPRTRRRRERQAEESALSPEERERRIAARRAHNAERVRRANQERDRLRREARHQEEEARRQRQEEQRREKAARQEAERARLVEKARQRVLQEPLAQPVAAADRISGPPYSSENSHPNIEGGWNLLEIRCGRDGTRDPRKRRPFKDRSIPVVLRLPRFCEEPRYVFPPVNIVRRDGSPAAESSQPIVVDCPSTPLCPWGLRVPPSTPLPAPGEFIRVNSIPVEIPDTPTVNAAVPDSDTEARDLHPVSYTPVSRPDQAPFRTPPVPTCEEEPGSDTLLLSAFETPETFSPSLIGSPPAKRFCGSHRRNLDFD